MVKKLFRYFSILLLALGLVFVGCDKKGNPEEIQSKFDGFLDEIFVKEVQSDALILNYSLSQPENYGIQYKEMTIGEYTIDKMYEGLSLTENYLERLKTFDYGMLTPEQQLTYDILQNYLENDLNFGNFFYYSESLGPTTGVQAQLPILLAEYNFYTKEDIDRYIKLLPSVYDYFEDIVLFEQEKSKRGLFMSDAVADSIIAQCEAFITDPEDNFLISYFNEKINLYHGLTQKERKAYKEVNKDRVYNYIIPAYELLIQCLKDLKGTGNNNGGLYAFPDGPEYYEYLAHYKTGSDKSMKEIAQMLDGAIGKGILDITTISMRDEQILEKYQTFRSFPLTDPEEILQDLKADIIHDFPEPVPVNCDIKYVHDSLSQYLSPAMYLTPAIDDYINNNIYINGSDVETLSTIYTTVAHEGYPGHLYQNVYFRDQNPAPIRNLMDFLGYDEGWATYVEMYSYHLSGIDDNLADFLEANNVVILCMYARADIGIHYEGWSKEKAIAYIEEFIGERDTAELIYSVLLQEPGIYLPYSVGYLEILELREKAETQLSDRFNAKEFHKFLLDIGPAQFGVIEDYMETWIDDIRSADTSAG